MAELEKVNSEGLFSDTIKMPLEASSLEELGFKFI
jgi:hypothetical protein